MAPDNHQHHLDLADSDFAEKFADLSLDPRLFTHEAHLRLAWIHLRRHGVQKAVDNITAQIQSFSAHHGDSEKYHETVTVAAVHAVHHFLQKKNAHTFPRFIEKYPQLLTNFKGLLNSHYSDDIFQNDSARKRFITPDLQPFDDQHTTQ